MKDRIISSKGKSKILKASLVFTCLYLLVSLVIFVTAYKSILPEYRWLMSVSALIYTSAHVVLTVIGLGFNFLGFIHNSQDFALAGFVLYALALFSSPFNIFIIGIPMIMSIVAAFQLDKVSKEETFIMA